MSPLRRPRVGTAKIGDLRGLKKDVTQSGEDDGRFLGGDASAEPSLGFCFDFFSCY